MTSTAAKAGARRPSIDPRFAQRWIEARREEGRRRLKVVAVVGGVVAVSLVLVGLLYSPAFEVRHVRATESAAGASTPAPGGDPSSGTLPIPAATQLAKLAGVAGHPLMINVDTAAAAARLDANPWLGDARVARQWPDTLSLSAVTRIPIAAVAAPANAPTRYALVDPTGRVLASVPVAPAGLPLLSLPVPVPAVGQWLPGSSGPGADPALPAARLADTGASSASADVPAPDAAALIVLDSMPADLRSEVSSVTASPLITLSVVGPPTRGAKVQFVLGDGSMLAAKISALETLVVQADLSQTATIDLTVPSRPEATPAAPG